MAHETQIVYKIGLLINWYIVNDVINYTINRKQYTFLNPYLSYALPHIILLKPLRSIDIEPVVVREWSVMYSWAIILYTEEMKAPKKMPKNIMKPNW